MRAIVTGGTGFIGSHICNELIRQGWRVLSVDNQAGGKAKYGEAWRYCDGSEMRTADILDLTEKDLKGIDVVFHNAASKCTVCMDDPKKDLMVNAWGTFHLLNLSLKMGVKKFIHASTGSVNNGRPASYYGVSKQAGESYVRVFGGMGLDYNILRYYHVYGPRQDDSDKGGVIPIFIRRALAGEPIIVHGDGRQVRHFTHVSDVVAANLWAVHLDMKYTREFDVISDTQVTILELAHVIKGLTGSKSEILFADEKPGDIRFFNAKNDALKMTGFNFKKTFEKGLIETVEWYSKQL